MQTPTAFCVVLTTTADEAHAAQLAQQLVQQRLAACVQIHPIRSIYVWNGKSCDTSEWQLLIKTRSDLYPALQDFIRQNHSYETPEIVQIPISAGLDAYLQWISDATTGNTPSL